MKRTAVGAAVVVAMIALSACSSPTPEVTTIPAPAEVSTPSPTPTPTAAAEGTRGAPLAPGQMRKLVDGSMWTIGADSATVVQDGYVVLPLHIVPDWDAGRAQNATNGVDIESVGVDPWSSLWVEYISASGRSFTTYDYMTSIENDFMNVGTIYPPAGAFSANIAVNVPNEEIPGGVWKVSNGNGDAVFIAGG